MYEELVKRLKETTVNHDDKCESCPYEEDYPCCVDCLDEMHIEAADAIEKLQEDSVPIDDMEMILSEVAKPLWIPVTERLPEEAYACLAIVWDNNPYSGDTFLNYYPEFVGYGGGSWNDYNGDEIPLDVVYWMKLPQIPEPPKEE